MQSPLATPEPAHSALRWPVEGAATVLPVEMGMEGEGHGGVLGERETVEQQHECKGETGKS